MRIDGGDAGGGNGDEPGLVQAALFEIGEVEGSVANQRSAQAQAILRLSHRKNGLRKGIRRIESAVLEISVEIAMKRVAAAARHDIDVPSKRAAEFSLSARSYYLHFFHDVQTIEGAGESGCIVVIRKPVYHETVREITLASDGDALARNRRSFGEKLVGGSVCGRDSRGHQGRVKEVPAVQGQLSDLSFSDGFGDF